VPALGLAVTVVGFDLDMTLIDPRRGVTETMARLSEATGRYVDGDLVASRLGPPLDVELAHWFPADEVQAAGALYRELYVEHAIPLTVLLPGAAEAVAAARSDGGRVVVITAKLEANAVLTLEALGVVVDEVLGWRWGAQKSAALVDTGARVYVGDHVSDVGAAAGAGVPCVAVPTGPCTAADLVAAGATTVLGSLEEFPAWWESARMTL
jgi:phosphoglycolate phosphatase